MEKINYHVQSSLLDSFAKEIKNLKNKYVIFHFSFYDITPKNGNKVEKIVDIAKKENLNILFTFVPPCIFSPDEKSLNLFLNHKEIPVFVLEDWGVTQVLTKEGKDLVSISILYKKCVNCNYRYNGKCGGIYKKKKDKLESLKVYEWYYEYLNKLDRGKILDLGSGTTPYLNKYENLVSKNDGIIFICLEPMKFSIKVLDSKIKTKNKIMQVCGLGEDFPFSENLFDVILMRASYSHFLNLEKVLKNSYKSLKRGGRLIIFEEHSQVSDKSDFWTRHHRDHNLKEAISEIEKHKFEVLDNFSCKRPWGILAVKS